MSDEAAFLAALNANPGDDTARLVYADWLDEHNEPVRAEYLRLVVEVARGENDVAAHPDGVRLCALAKQLDASWRLGAGSRFALVLDDFSDIVKTIKWYREITSYGLGEAKRAVEANPHALYVCVPFEMAFAAYARRPESSVKLRLAPSTQHAVTDGTNYQLTVRCSVPTSPLVGPARPQVEREALNALGFVLAAAGRTVAEGSLGVSLLGQDIVLADGLSRDQVKALAGEFAASSPARPAPRWWYLQMNHCLTPHPPDE